MSNLILFFDGRCTGNGTPVARAGYGWVITRDGETIASDKGLAGAGAGVTMNTAEYAGLLAGLRALLALDRVDAVEVRGDSQVVIRQVRGDCGCWTAHLKPLHQEVLDLAGQLMARGCAVSLRWIPRGENKRADALSRAAFADLERAQGADGYTGDGETVAVPLTRATARPSPSAAGWLE